QLNDEQFKVVREGEGPCLVLAGAGSGKTRTIIYRLAHLLSNGTDPKNICLVTFTNKAAREMISRAELLLGYKPKGLIAGTFHHMANFLLRRYGRTIGLEPNFTIIDEDDKKSLIKASIADAGIDTKQRRFPSPAVLKEIFSFSKNSRNSLEQVLEIKHPKFLEIKEQIKDVRRIFEKKKKDGNMVDFDDLLTRTLNLLETQPHIREGLARTFKYVLVDEYQDTNPIQAAILYHLSSHHKNILVVGDDAQSIYSFRAADIKNILDFPKTYPQAKTFKLETNYRSTPNILDLANNVIANNINQFPKNLKSIKKAGIMPQVLTVHNKEDEAKFIADRILELRDEGVELRDMAVLFRAAYHSEVLEMELTRRDIPYDFRGGVKFFERAHIKDTIAYLRAFFNLQDEAAWMRILSFGLGVGPATAKRIFEEISQKREPHGILEIDGSHFGIKARTSWEEILSIWKKFVNLEASPSVFIDAVVNSYYRDYLENKYENFEERLQDLYEMANYSSRYKDLASFLSEITLYEEVGVNREQGGEYEAEKMILSTIHQAKGLEWKVVFIINLIEGAFPNRRALMEEGGLEEERRLFYVACTRAKDQLYLSYSFTGGNFGYATVGGGMSFNEPSTFVRELERGLLERVEFEEDDLPVIDIDGEELPKKSYLPDINLNF
ncbi:ATP-dependent helicase, partial [Patescibacteria group bacterium]|nr:ATP-dependent helicase [Patescibacteria group bacterium]